MSRIILATIPFLAALLFIGCSNSMKEDAAKIAELQCENLQITMGGAVKVIGNEMDLSKIQAHQEKIRKFSMKMMEKYDGLDERQKFAELAQNKLLGICL